MTPLKPDCLLQLSRLFNSAGNRVEYKWLLVHSLSFEESGGRRFGR